MSEDTGKCNNNTNYINEYDNSDLVLNRKSKDIASAYDQMCEMKALKLYFETLKLEGEIQKSNDLIKVKVQNKNGKYDDKMIPMNRLVPRQSEFEATRRLVISRLYDAPEGEIKKLCSQFEVEGIFELSSKIANNKLDKQRREQVATEFNFDDEYTTAAHWDRDRKRPAAQGDN